jgi:hypothetical protein
VFVGGVNLGLTPQALCRRLLRRLETRSLPLPLLSGRLAFFLSKMEIRAP